MELKVEAVIFLILSWSLIISFLGVYYYKTSLAKLLRKYKSLF